MKMKRNKKIIILMVLLLIIGQVKLRLVSATENIQITVPSVSASIGELVEIPIEITKNPGITSLNIKIDFNNTVLQPVAVKAEKDIRLVSNWQDPNTDFSKLSNIILGFDWGNNFSGTNKIATITFKALDTGNTSLSFNSLDINNAVLSTVSEQLDIGKINIDLIKKGDLDGDGRISVIDARKAKQATMKEVVLTERERNAADVNSDGKVNIIDARKIKGVAMKETTIAQ